MTKLNVYFIARIWFALEKILVSLIPEEHALTRP